MTARGARTRPRLPGFVHAGFVTGVVALLTAMVLTTRQPPPPTIAEFAPQAVQQIKQTESSQDFGFGSGQAEASLTPASPLAQATAEQPPVEVPRVRRCVGDPPRQIEDPQSPPCVPYWPGGDNGGATYQGVTASEIKVIAPDYNAEIDPLLQSFFNSRFEFYGRKINIIKGTPNVCGAQNQRAEAAQADEEFGVFATLNHIGCYGFDYYDELARRGIISSAVYPAYSDAAAAQRRPYFWQYPMGTDRMFRNIGEWICGRLAGRNANHSGDPLMAGRKRRFGIVFESSSSPAFTGSSIDPVVEELQKCGERPYAVGDGGTIHPNTPPERQPHNTILEFKQAEVSSVICLCNWASAGNLGDAASTEGYYPEWLVSTYLLNDYNFLIRGFTTWPREQLENMFGLTFRPRQLLPEHEPPRWAERDAGGKDPSSGTSVLRFWWQKEYHSMLMLASGIQMAGPNLTPETFERGLHRARFPNPDHPSMTGAVGFNGDHSMTEDAAEFWWSNTARGPYEDEASGGTICYVDGGKRYSLGRWPQGGDPFFQGPCDSGA